MDEPSASVAALQRCALRLSTVLTAAFWVVGAMLLAERLGYAGLYRGDPVDLPELARQLLLSVPPIFYLAALWKLRTAVAEIARREAIGSPVATAIKMSGALLITGSIAGLALPLVAHFWREPAQRLINADVATLILAAIGMGQMFIAGLMQRAAEAERELREFF